MRNDSSSQKRKSRNPHLDEDLCLDLLYGLVSAEEAEEVRSHLTECHTCEKMFRDVVSEQERLRATSRLRSLPGRGLTLERHGVITHPSLERERVRQWNDLVSRARGIIRAWFEAPRYRLAGAVVAVGAILLIILWPQGKELRDRPQLRWLPAYTGEILSRGVEGEATNEEIALGLEAYNRRDTESAVAALGEAEAQGLAESIRLVYWGSALAWRGEFQQAIEVLNRLADTRLPEPWAGEVLWTKYVSLYRSGRRASADSLLRILADSPDEIGDRARRSGDG